MEDTKMTLQERESKLYDEFDRFKSEPGESVHSYYLRYSKLINDINIIKMSMSNMQINTKFVNHLQPKWSRFVTAAKQARNLHSIKFDQLYAFLKHNEKYAKEFREMRQLFLDPLALLANTYSPPPLYNTITSRNTPTNNQLKTSSNLRIHATIQNGQVMVQNDQGRQSQGYARKEGEGHMAKQCIAKKRVKDVEWFKEKMLLAQAQESWLHTTTNFKPDHVDAYDSDCDDEATTSVIFMASLSPKGSISGDIIGPTYDSDIPCETEYIEHSFSNNDSYDELTSNNNVISYADYMVTIENDAAQYVPPPAQDNDMILSETLIISEESRLEMKVKQTKVNTKPIDYSKLNNLYEHFVPQKQLSAEQVYWAPVSKPSLPKKVTKVFPKKLPSTSQVHKNLPNARDLLDKFDVCIKKRTTLSPHEIGSWDTTDIKGAFKQVAIPFFKNLRETFKLFETSLYKEVSEMKRIFQQMEDEINNKSFEINDLKVQLQDKTLVVNELKHQLAHLHGKSQVPQCESHGIVSYTDARGSKPRSNTKNDRIQQPSSRSQKNKVEAQPRKFKSSSNKNNHVSACNANIKNVSLSKNFTNVCVSCNECLFSANYDACVVKYLKDVQKRKKGKPITQKEKIRWKSTRRVFKTVDCRNCYVRSLEGIDLLSGSCGSNLYTISMDKMMKSSPIFLLSKASKIKSWLWHRRLSHLNFGAINQLAKQGLVKELPKLMFTKYHLCSACQMGKRKKEPNSHKPEPSTNEKLQMLHMDLYRPMRQAQVSLKAIVRDLPIENGIEFINQTLRNYIEDVGITHHTSVASTPQQNGVVERRNRMLVEAVWKKVDMAYWLRHRYAVSSLMDTAHWMSEQ
ncbi:retrovirus-related pol polyprotein from transposon TNT 1-94 [Tanacetum coccineum]